MASVRFTNIAVEASIRKQVAGKVVADLTAAGGSSGQLNNRYEAHIKTVSRKVLDKAVMRLDTVAKKEYTSAIRQVKRELNAGIPLSNGNPAKGGKSWKPLSARYAAQKLLGSNPENASLFWKNTGDLAAEFNGFASTYQAQISKSTQSINAVTVGKRGRNTKFRFKIEFKYPAPALGGKFFEDIFLKSFFQAKALSGPGQDTGSPALNRIGFIEGINSKAPARHRPFIAQIMANRGSKFQSRVARILKAQTT